MRRYIVGEWIVREPVQADRGKWEELFTAYGEFYKRPVSPEMAERVWRWIDEEYLGVRCLIVCREDEIPVGITHYRPFPRPLAASIGGFLDDLFVNEEERSSGAVEALFIGLGHVAVEGEWSLLRGITADDNYRARAKYDQFAKRTAWITYEVTADENPVLQLQPRA